MTPELAPPHLTPTPHQREDVSALDRFNVHCCPTRRVFNGSELELVTRQATTLYLYHSTTAATNAKSANDDPHPLCPPGIPHPRNQKGRGRKRVTGLLHTAAETRSLK
ncbi:uncharacterized protein TNCV_1975181 [Trichonephila clavipes]|nr:uncharacterized protein TNCV_1975181 [Trichonephila clavipes]